MTPVLHSLAPHSLEDRRAIVRRMMVQADVDVLVCAGNGHHMIDLANAVAHLTGFRSIGPAVLLLDAEGGVEFLVSKVDACGGMEGLPSASVRVGIDIDTGSVQLPGVSGRVASIGVGSLPRRLAAQLLTQVEPEPRSVDKLLYELTGRKTDHEISCAREATRIAEEGWQHMLEIVRPGMRECDLAVAVNLFMRGLGANDLFLMLNCGPRADAVMPSSERPIEAGDLLLTELSPSVDGQFVQICRTAAIGRPADITGEKYGLLIDAMHKGMACVRPGVRMGEVCLAIDDDLSAAGYAPFSRPPFIRRRGHGLGSGSVSPGDVGVDNDTVLEPGMLFMVHPNQFLPETGYMMCGEPVLVTDGGFEVLSERHAELAVVESGGAKS